MWCWLLARPDFLVLIAPTQCVKHKNLFVDIDTVGRRDTGCDMDMHRTPALLLMVIHETIYRLQTTCSLNTMESVFCVRHESPMHTAASRKPNAADILSRTFSILCCYRMFVVVASNRLIVSACKINFNRSLPFSSSSPAPGQHRLSERCFSISDKIRNAKTSFCAQSSGAQRIG